jgi:hypothetical protein
LCIRTSPNCSLHTAIIKATALHRTHQNLHVNTLF